MGSLKAKEDYLKETKALMRSILESHGVTITDDTPFRAYAAGINEAVTNSGSTEGELATVKAKLAGVLSADTLTPLVLEAEDLAGLTVIRKYAMYQHSSLASLSVPSHVTSIDPNAFYGCSALETVVLPKGIRLQSGCFINCSGLKQVYLPAVTDVSECPRLITDTVFPAYDALPDCDFIIPDDASYVFYSQAERWPDVLRGRGSIENYTG